MRGWSMIFREFLFFSLHPISFDSLRIKERIMHFKWKFLFVHFLLFNIFRIIHSPSPFQLSFFSFATVEKMFFVTIIQFYPVFIFFIHRGKRREGGKWFGVEGFSIIIFCVIMIIFLSLFHFFGKSFMFACKRAPWRLNLYFCISEYDRKMYLSAWVLCMCGWMVEGVKWEMWRKKKTRPDERTFLFAFAFFLCLRIV